MCLKHQTYLYTQKYRNRLKMFCYQKKNCIYKMCLNSMTCIMIDITNYSKSYKRKYIISRDWRKITPEKLINTRLGLRYMSVTV